METTTTGTGSGSPCGACKFLRRKCAADCVFAPYFASEQGPSRFAAIHKVFGASNVSKLLLHIPVVDRCEAAVTIAYEAQARMRDPVYGCVAHIFALQQQVAYLQAQLIQAKAQIAQNLVNNNQDWRQLGGGHDDINVSSSGIINGNHDNINNNYNSHGDKIPYSSNNYQNSISPNNCCYYNKRSPISPQSSLESVDYHNIINNNINKMKMMNSVGNDHDDVMVMEGIISNFDEQDLEEYRRNAKKRPYNNELGELQALALRMMRN